jgi:hypothetical protein
MTLLLRKTSIKKTGAAIEISANPNSRNNTRQGYSTAVSGKMGFGDISNILRLLLINY